MEFFLPSIGVEQQLYLSPGVSLQNKLGWPWLQGLETGLTNPDFSLVPLNGASTLCTSGRQLPVTQAGHRVLWALVSSSWEGAGDSPSSWTISSDEQCLEPLYGGGKAECLPWPEQSLGAV